MFICVMKSLLFFDVIISLLNTLNELSIQWEEYNTIDLKEEYLVFGSFSVAEAFLKEQNG